MLNATQRIEPFFSMWFKEFFHKNDSKHFTLFKIWLQELNLFWLNMTQRIESFFKYYSKNWTLFNIWLEELNIFFNRTFSIWLKKIKFFQYVLKSWTLFLVWPQEWTFWKNESNIWTLFEHDSKNWIFSYDSNNWALF